VIWAEDNEGQKSRPKMVEMPILRGGQLLTPTEAATVTLGQLKLQLPLGAISQSMVLTTTPLVTVSHLPTGLLFANHAFTLQPYLYGLALTTTFTFSQPITLTFSYRDEDITNLDESTLELRYWDGQAWTTNGITRLSHDREANVIQFTLSHLSDFALFGQAKTAAKTGVYLPLIVK